MALTPGTRLGPYEVTGYIGAGGMGEVYRATDTNLKRQVAIKILPETLAHDTERLARFQREAEVLASLNHPHIAAIYGLERAGGTTALVMELVEGPTLADRLASAGALPVDEALAIAKQIAEALEAAHEQGIVHRDLKPANMKVRDDGTVKVLDFGLAKIVEPGREAVTTGGRAAVGASQSPTITTPAMTMAGVILGTAAYMSPEQARGKPADKRSDIWAFGCVLYEMLTGRRAFDGGEVSDTLAFVLTKEPDWRALPPRTPASIRRLLRRSLTRDKRFRLPEIGSARLEIDDAQSEAIVEPRPDRGTSRSKRAAVVAAAAVTLALAAGAIGLWLSARPQPSAQPIARVLIGVAPAERLLSGYRGDPSTGQGRPSRTAMALSPDGRTLVFTAERGGVVHLYRRPLEQLDATAIAGTEGAMSPFFSPDGQWVGFYAAGALRKVPLNGGPVQDLCRVDLPYGAAWSPTGHIVFALQTGGLWQVGEGGGEPRALTTLDESAGEYSHRLPHVVPDGRAVLFTVTKRGFPAWDDDTDVVVQALDGGGRKVVIAGGADARVVPTGHVVYVRRGTLMGAAFDLQRLETTGAPVGLLPDVMQAAGVQPVMIDTGAGQFAVSSSGALTYVSGGIFPENRWSLVFVDPRTGESQPLNVPPGAYLAPRFSPDGKRLAFAATSGDWDLWTYDVARGFAERIPLPGEQSVPVWTPGGSRIAFSSLVDGARHLSTINPDTNDPPVTLPSPGWPASWRDERTLAFVRDGGDIWLLQTGAAEEARPLVSSAAFDVSPDFSPDGRYLAYSSVSVERGDTQRSARVYVEPYAGPGRRELVSSNDAGAPVWRRPDGRELYYIENVSDTGSSSRA